MADTFEEARADLVDFQAHKYRTGSSLESTYHRERGLLVIPIMGPVGTAPVVARVHAPYGLRTVEFGYSKVDSPPLMPAAADTHTGDTILSETHTFPAPGTNMDGHLVFGVRGTFTYVQPLGGRTPEDKFPIDAHPFPTAIDGLGEFNTAVLTTSPGQDQFMSDAIDGRWNRDNVDARVLSAYKIIG